MALVSYRSCGRAPIPEGLGQLSVMWKSPHPRRPWSAICHVEEPPSLKVPISCLPCGRAPIPEGPHQLSATWKSPHPRRPWSAVCRVEEPPSLKVPISCLPQGLQRWQ
ncbi:DNA-directed RNA polymerases I, II, and III subunit RPABC5 isoform X7 [Vombatus ursinus]|uniref:DNA-directed RNA polymerases I, II, and III subunit RPABC5 isoform X7 n=1 Tax=Vombatus ursinus TaxID=29139 RepID=UPI000FFD7A87|nr:DNA-directed RNA polymerases I, II, and III subunit RPABC5 isoform X7 [Vombatus ursinus]